MKMFLPLFLILILIIATDDDADAAPAVKHSTTCTYTGETVGWGHVGDNVGDLALDWDNSIETYRCRASTPHGVIRYMRAVADTTGEHTELVRMASADASAAHPITVCATTSGYYAIDLAYFYYAYVKAISRTEHRFYSAWVGRYAERHDCVVYDGAARM